MRLLFAITVACFCAVLWVALALARRIRLAQLLQARPVRRHTPAQEFFEAGEFRTPRPLRLEQDILQQKPRRPLAEIFSVPAPAATAPTEDLEHTEQTRASEPTPIRPPAAYASLFGQTISIAPIDSHLYPSVSALTATDTATSNAAPAAAPVVFTLHRRPPQPTRLSGLRRVDLSQYNKDMGDLTDPYTHPLRASGTQGPVPTDRASRQF